jgi:hypothetical protein
MEIKVGALGCQYWELFGNWNGNNNLRIIAAVILHNAALCKITGVRLKTLLVFKLKKLK